MSVADCLGITEGSELLVQADQAWPVWCEQYPRLRVVTDTATMRSWLKQHVTADGDELLRCLARLAAAEGGNDIAAAAALAWALMPGACALSHRLRTLTCEIDQVVAGQLWLEVRTFPWQRLRKVSANILLNTRAGVLHECGVTSQVERTDPTWAHTRTVEESMLLWDDGQGRCNRSEVVAAELFELLEWACEHDVITCSDRSLLLGLVEAADRAAISRTGRANAGLLSNDISDRVAGRLGISPRTVRRRARLSIDALADACGHGKASA